METQLVPSHTPLKVTQEPIKKLDAYTPQEVVAMLDRGDVTDEEAYHYTLRRDIREDFFGMKKNDVIAAYDAGLIDDHQADLWADRKLSPVGFHVKDKLSAVASGIEKAGEETIISAVDFFNWLVPVHTLYGEKQPSAREALNHLNKALTPDSWEQPINRFFEVNTTSGEIVEGITQFITSFAPISKGMKAYEVAETILESSKVGPFLNQFPRLKTFMYKTLEGTIAGAITDATAFNPYEYGINDLIAELPGLSEDIKGFLRTDPENPEWTERSKKGLAGVVPGVIADYVFHGLTIFKNRLWHKAVGNEDEVARVVDEIVITPKPTEVPATDPIEAKAIAKYQWMRNKEGGQSYGNKELIVPIDEDIYNKFIRPLSSSDRDFEVYQEIVPTATHANLVWRDEDTTWWIAGVGSGDEFKQLRSETPWAKEVKSFSDPDAILHGRTADSEASAPPVNQLTTEAPLPYQFVDQSKKKVSKLEVDDATSMARAMTVLDDVMSGKVSELDPDSAINLTKYSNEEVVSLIARMSQEYTPELLEAKGGVRSMGLLEKRTSNSYQELSKLPLDKLEERVKARIGGLQNIDTFLNATRDVLNSMSETAIKLYKEANGDIEKEIEAYQILARAGEIQKYLDYGTTQIGRGLQSLKRDVKTRKFDPTALAQAETSGELVHMRKTLEAMSRLKNKKDRLKYAKKLAGGRILQGMLEYVQAGLVSGLDTTKVNILGNSTAFLWDSVIHHAGVLGYSLTHPKELSRLKEIYSYWHGFGKGVKMAVGSKDARVLKAWKEMGSQIDKGSDKFSRTPLLVDYFKQKGWEKAATVSDVFFLPFRNLTAQDEFFKNIAYYSRREALIQREAMDKMFSEGMKKQDVGKFIKFLQEDTPDFIHLQALQEAQETTFTKPLEGAAKNIARVINTPVTLWVGDKPYISHPGLLFRLGFMPFYNIAANLLDYAVERTPLKVFGYKFQSAWKAGGVERAEALARAASGTIPFMLGMAWYADNKITAYMDRETAAGARNAGIQPYAFLDMTERESESYMKYAPVTFLMAWGANLSRLYDHYNVPEDIDRDVEKLFRESILAFTDPVLNQHFMKSLKDSLDFFAGAEFMNVEKFWLNQQNKLIPFSSLLDQAQRNYFDDWVRETSTTMDLIRRKLHGLVPGVEAPLPKMDTVYGTPIQNYKKQIPWYHWESLAGTNIMPITEDKGKLELLRFGVNTKAPDDKITIKGVTRKMTPEEYVQYNYFIYESGIQDSLNKLVNDPKWDGYAANDPITAKNLLSRIISEHRQVAKKMFLAQNQEAIQEIKAGLQKRKDALVGAYTATNPREYLESWAKFVADN